MNVALITITLTLKIWLPSKMCTYWYTCVHTDLYALLIGSSLLEMHPIKSLYCFIIQESTGNFVRVLLDISGHRNSEKWGCYNKWHLNKLLINPHAYSYTCMHACCLNFLFFMLILKTKLLLYILFKLGMYMWIQE